MRYPVRFALLFFFIFIFMHDAGWGGDIPFTSSTVVRFATLEEARALLGTTDTFTAVMGSLERKIRMKREDDPGEAGYLKFAAAQGLEWTMQAEEPVRADLGRLRERLGQLKLSLPPRILLVRSTGAEDAGMPYTRGAAIVIPKTYYDNRTLVHELFHVMTRHDPVLRSRIFAAIGFTRCDPIQLPPELEAWKITNPDSPLLDHTIVLSVTESGTASTAGKAAREKEVVAVPLALVDWTRFGAREIGRSYFNYLGMPFLEVERSGGGWRPRIVNGAPVFVRGRTNYIQQVGRMNHSLSQAEEIAAGNFETFFFFPNAIDNISKMLKIERAKTPPRSVRETLVLSRERSKADATTSATADHPAQMTLLETMQTLFSK